MDYLVVLSCMALLIGLVLYAGYPLFTSRQPVPSLSGTARAWKLAERKEQVYTTLKELEFDHVLGKLPEEDFQRLRQELEAEALHLITQLDQMDGRVESRAVQDRIEEDVRALRHREPATRTQCSSCGASRRAEDRFCSQCGATFEEAG